MKKDKFGGCLMFETSCLPYGVSRISPPTAAAYHLLAQNSRHLSCSVAQNQPGPPCSVCPPVTISTNLFPRMMDRTKPHTGPENMWIQCCTRISWAIMFIYINMCVCVTQKIRTPATLGHPNVTSTIYPQAALLHLRSQRLGGQMENVRLRFTSLESP